MNFNTLIPELSVKDHNKSLQFYVNTLGFHVEYSRPAEQFSFLSLNNAQLMIEQENSHWVTAAASYPYGRGIHLQIEVKDIETVLQNITKENIKLFIEPHIAIYETINGKRKQHQFLIQDPDGYLLRIFHPLP